MFDKKLGYDPIETSDWDPVDGIVSDADAAEYLNLMLEQREDWAFCEAVGTIARAYSMGKVAQATGLSRESLYRSLSAEGNPRFTTVLKVLDSMGYAIEIKPKHVAGPAASASTTTQAKPEQSDAPDVPRRA